MSPRKLTFSVHAIMRMFERGISVIEEGRVIEDYPDDFPILAASCRDGLDHDPSSRGRRHSVHRRYNCNNGISAERKRMRERIHQEKALTCVICKKDNTAPWQNDGHSGT